MAEEPFVVKPGFDYFSNIERLEMNTAICHKDLWLILGDKPSNAY